MSNSLTRQQITPISVILAILIVLAGAAAAPLHAAPGDMVHHAEGRLRIGVATQGRTLIILDNGASLKIGLDKAYALLRPQLNDAVASMIRNKVGGDVSAQLANPDSTESLRSTRLPSKSAHAEKTSPTIQSRLRVHTGRNRPHILRLWSTNSCASMSILAESFGSRRPGIGTATIWPASSPSLLFLLR